MSISSEITRITQNISDSLDAVAAKGVTVPSGSNSDDLPGLIAQITSSSGSGSGAISIIDIPDAGGGVVRTITAVDISGDTVTAEHLESGYTAHDAQGNPVTGTLVPGGGGNDFIVNLIYNSSTDIWSPDCTFAELQAAYNAGKTIATLAYNAETGYDCESFGYYDDGDDCFYYEVYYVYSAMFANSIKCHYYIFDSSGVTDDGYQNLADVSSLQAKTNITPTESSQTITPDASFNALSSVQIDAISSSYVGSGVARKSSSDLTASGATVTVPAGYYDAQASKTVASGTEGTPTATKGAVSGNSVTVTPSVTNSAGYIAGGTKTGTGVSVSASELVSGTYNVTSSGTKDVTNYASASIPAGTVTAPSSISGTAATVSTGTNTLTLTKTVSVTPNVTTAGYVTGGTAGNASVSLQASVTTKAAATITPTKSAQTIASGTYLTGTQTIAAIPAAYQDVTSVDATAGDVMSGKKIVNSGGTVVTGTLVVQTIYSGSSAPLSSTGVNGDIYIQT